MARPFSSIEPRLQSLGPRLRHERLSRGLSLTRLAQAAGLTKSLLSQVERGIAEPSLASLRKVALALGVPLSQLFSEPPRLGAVVRRGEGKEIRWARLGVSYEVLSSDDRKNIQMLLLRLAPGGKTCEKPTPGRSAGEECAVVLSGTVEVVVGEQTYRLGEGDSISLDCTAAHQYANVGTTPALLVAAMSTSTL
jgi:transcriptional regulator with XRE-family HTH domain